MSSTSRRHRLHVTALAATAALALAGCSGDGDGAKKDGGDTEAATPSPSTTVEVPEGVELTEPGTQLEFGDTATLAHEVGKEGGVLGIRVDSASKGAIGDFAGFELDDPYKKKGNYFYVRVTVENAGEEPFGDVPVPLWGISGDNTLLQAVQFTSAFTTCPTEPLPADFEPGAKFKTCLVFLSPNRGTLEGVSYRPTEDYVPVEWRGDVTDPSKKGKGKKKGGGQQQWSATAAPPHPGLRLGALHVDTPVVLAPMAGITNAAYRRLCREQGAGLYVCEMITSRGLVERDETTLKMLAFDEVETTRSVQLYGTDPVYVGKATELLCAEHGVDHVDLNFGCPVPKVTRKGGGGALPWKRNLLGAILTAAVEAAAPYGVPVTMKTRKGIDDDHLTYLNAGRIAEEAGCAAIALHGRTVAQAYSGTADWSAIGELAAYVSIPVLGNGDVWEAADALRMVEETGAAGVVVGRGCLGRPWLFRDLAAAFAGQEVATLPSLGEVAAMMRRHAELLVHHMGEERGCKEFRKHVAWYLKGFPVGSELRRSLALVVTLVELDALLDQLDPSAPFPVAELGTPRGRQGSPRRVVLPEGWLSDQDGSDCGATEDVWSGSGG